MAHDHSHSNAGADVLDIVPEGAGYAHGHHGHVIVPLRVLLAVLAALMAFTLLTVFAARAEEWFAGTFNVIIPQWMNVFIALSIAVVKSTLVFAFFMQLRYDNPLNTMVVVFTIFVFFFFIGFIMIDLGNRSILYSYKDTHLTPGGTGLTGNKSIAQLARDESAARVERWMKLRADGKTARADLLTGVNTAIADLRKAAQAAGTQADDDAKASIDSAARAITEASAPFGRDNATDEDIRALERAVYAQSGTLNREAAVIVGAVGDFEKALKSAIADYRLRTRPLEHRDEKFALDEIERYAAANKELPGWLHAFHEWHSAHAEGGHDAGADHGHARAWNDEGPGNTAEQSRPRTGITLPELAPAAGEHGGAHPAEPKPH